MSLDKIIKEMQTLKILADENVEEGNPQTLTARRGRKVNAILKLQELREDYTKELMKSAIFIVVTGNKRDEFTQIATNEKFSLFSVDPDFFYKDLASRVPAALYQKASPSNLFDVLGRHLEDKMVELGLREYNQLIFHEKYIQPMNTPEEFTEVLKASINEQIGSEIVGVQAINSIADGAIKNGYSAKNTPIVLSTGDDKFAITLSNDLERLTSRVFLVIAGRTSKEVRAVEGSISHKEIDEAIVKKTLDQIIVSLKK